MHTNCKFKSSTVYLNHLIVTAQSERIVADYQVTFDSNYLKWRSLVLLTLDGPTRQQLDKIGLKNSVDLEANILKIILAYEINYLLVTA